MPVLADPKNHGGLIRRRAGKILPNAQFYRPFGPAKLAGAHGIIVARSYPCSQQFNRERKQPAAKRGVRGEAEALPIGRVPAPGTRGSKRFDRQREGDPKGSQ